METKKYIDISPMEVVSVKHFSLMQCAGDHAYVNIVATLDEEKKDTLVKEAIEGQQMTVTLRKEVNSETLFVGTIETMEVNCNAGVYEAYITAASCTCMLDRRKKCRSFQDVSMDYQAVISALAKGYPQFSTGYLADVIFPKIEGLIMQYEETDWQFIKRMASHLHLPIVPDIVADHPKFMIGLPVPMPWQDDFPLELNYTISKFVSTFAEFNEKLEADQEKRIPDNAAFCYDFEFDANKALKIGDTVTFQGKTLYIQQSNSYLKGNVLSHQIKCVEKEGFFVEKYQNEKIAGLSLRAKVTQAKQDKLEVIFENVEDINRDKPYPFSYLTPYSTKEDTGIYFMPEIDDIVLINFPTDNEEDAVAYGSIRPEGTDDEKMKDPKIKYIRTSDGKEIMLGEKEIKISTKDKKLYILISEDDGIEISSSKSIKIQSDKEITLNASKKLEIAAEKEIQLSCKSSKIKLGATLDIKGDLSVN